MTSTRELKAGDIVEITKVPNDLEGHPYFSVGDKCVLLDKSYEEDYWGNFKELNKSCYMGGIWSLEDSEFKLVKDSEEEHTGGPSSYYMTRVENPTTLQEPYQAECNDIIESLDLTFAEANIVKAIWRTAAARQGKKKKGNNSIYDAEKCVFFSQRMLIAAQINKDNKNG